MITINCTSTEEADQVIGAFDIVCSVPDKDIPIPYEKIFISVNDEPYAEWGSFVNGLRLIESLQEERNDN